VASDDPRLTVREVEGRDPVRVVLDPRGRLPVQRRVFGEGSGRTMLVRARGVDAPVPDGVEVLRLPAGDRGRLAPGELVEALEARGWARILVEGGGVTVSRFLEAGRLDRLHVCVAPLILGSGRPGVSLPAIQTLDQALRPPCRTFRLGSDVLFDLELTPGGLARG